MTAPISLRDKQFQYLSGLYGPGLSYADMLQKYYGNGNKSISDLMDASYPGPGSMNDDYYTALLGSGSLSDKQYGSSSGGLVNTITNLVANCIPISAANWSSNDPAQWVPGFAGGVVTVNRQAGAVADIASSLYKVGAANSSPVLPVGVNHQRSFEILVDAQATILTAPGLPGSFVGGQVIPPGVWTKVVEQFIGTGLAQNIMAFSVQMIGVTPGVHVQLRRSFLAANPTGKELAYADGNTAGWSWSGTVNNSTSSGPVVYASDNPMYAGPTPLHAFWAGNPDMGVVADGVAIATWLNYGGGSLTNTGGTAQPTYKKADPTLNNKPSLVFNGTTNYLSQDVTDAVQNYYAVCISSGNTAGRGSLGTGGSVAATDGIGIRSGNSNWFGCAGTVLDSLVLASAAAPTLVVAKFAGVASDIQVNNNTAVVGSAGTEVLSFFKVGCMGLVGANSAFWVGSVNFAAIYSSDPRLDSRWSKILDYARSCGVPIP